MADRRQYRDKTGRRVVRHEQIKPPKVRTSRALWLALILIAAIFAWVWESQPNDANSRCVMQDGKRVCAVMD
jgi:hypothetical protein